VRALEAVPAGGWRVRCDDGPRRFDEVVLALPPATASRLLAPVCREAARELAGVTTASVGVVALAYDAADAADAPTISGLLVPRAEGRLVKAATVSSRKWPHLASPDRFVLRASVGRIDDDRPAGLEDGELADRVDAEVRWALRLRAPARDRAVVRWDDALPQYDVGHLERVDRTRHALAQATRGLHLGGAALDGVGLAARAAQARELADAVRSHARAVAAAG
jgi:protoporphyrinogen/coproporphyrinogen III oxidase